MRHMTQTTAVTAASKEAGHNSCRTCSCEYTNETMTNGQLPLTQWQMNNGLVANILMF